MDKDLATPQKPLEPTIRLNLDLADGRSFEKLVTFDAAVWSSAKDHADVRIGANRFTGDLHTYRITATVDDIAVDVTLEGEVPSWRPDTGHMLFGEDRALEFAWLPSVPQGNVTATYSIGDERHETTGIGYHDHNWGNVGLMEIIHDWYSARGQAGPYSVIASYITAHEKYGYAAIPIFMLAKDGVLIGDDPSQLTFEARGVLRRDVHPPSGSFAEPDDRGPSRGQACGSGVPPIRRRLPAILRRDPRRAHQGRRDRRSVRHPGRDLGAHVLRPHARLTGEPAVATLDTMSLGEVSLYRVNTLDRAHEEREEIDR
jgi:hypothetical protein